MTTTFQNRKKKQILTIISVSLVQTKNKKTRTWRFTNFIFTNVLLFKFQTSEVDPVKRATERLNFSHTHSHSFFFSWGGAPSAPFLFFSFPPLNTIKGGAHRKNKKWNIFFFLCFFKKSFTTYREKYTRVFFFFKKYLGVSVVTLSETWAHAMFFCVRKQQSS